MVKPKAQTWRDTARILQTKRQHISPISTVVTPAQISPAFRLIWFSDIWFGLGRFGVVWFLLVFGLVWFRV
jgi:hypothetical protein